MSVLSLIFVAASGLYVLYIYRHQASEVMPGLPIGGFELAPGDPAPVLAAKEGPIDPAGIRGRQVWVFLAESAPLPDPSWSGHFPDTLWIVAEDEYSSLSSRLKQRKEAGRPVSLSPVDFAGITEGPYARTFPLAVILRDGVVSEIHEGPEECRAALRERNGP